MKNLAFIILMLLITATCRSENLEKISFSGLKRSYSAAEIITVDVNNTFKDPAYIYTSAEILYDNGRWMAWPYDIENGRREAAPARYVILPGKHQNYRFDVRKAKLLPIPTGAKAEPGDLVILRFRVDMFDQEHINNQHGVEFYSKPFIVLKPYERP